MYLYAIQYSITYIEQLIFFVIQIVAYKGQQVKDQNTYSQFAKKISLFISLYQNIEFLIILNVLGGINNLVSLLSIYLVSSTYMYTETYYHNSSLSAKNSNLQAYVSLMTICNKNACIKFYFNLKLDSQQHIINH